MAVSRGNGNGLMARLRFHGAGRAWADDLLIRCLLFGNVERLWIS